MKIKLADLYRTLLENGFSDDDKIEILCREMEEIEIKNNVLIVD